MPRTVLLVDDDPKFRELVTPALQARGLRVLQAGFARDADRVLLAETPSVLVVDGLLPDMDGATWLSRLPAERRRIPVVFVSAFFRTFKDYERITRSLGAQLVLRKPIAAEVLADQVLGLLDRTEPEAAAQAATADAAAQSAAFAALAADYLKELPGKLDELSRSLAAARDGGGDAAAMREARTLAHRLSGTAGAYGFPAAGEAAARVEDYLVGALEAGAGLRASEVDPLLQGLARARGSLPDPTAALRPAAGGAPAAAPQGPSARAKAAPPRRLPRILLVDDDREHLAALRDRLSGEFEVAVASGPAEAIEKASLPRPQAIVLEAARDGRHAAMARQLRPLPHVESIPLIFAYSEKPPDPTTSSWAGASLSVPRAADAEQFAQVLRDALSRAPGGDPRVLVIDPSDSFVGGAVQTLRDAGIESVALQDPLRLDQALAEGRPDAVLLEAVLPGLSGFDLCRVLRAIPGTAELPVLMMSASASPESRAAAYQAGADDHLAKPLLKAELVARVRAQLDRVRLLRERAERDGLTGLWQRGAFLEAAGARLEACRRAGQPFAVALLRIQDLAALEARDLSAPDRLLAAAGALLRARLRAEDVRGRFGDGALCLALPGKDAAAARAIAQLALHELQALEAPGAPGAPLRATFSSAVAALADGSGSDSVSDLLRGLSRGAAP